MSDQPTKAPSATGPLIILALTLSIIFVLPAAFYLYQNASDWLFVPVEIPLPASKDIKSVKASIEADHSVVFESIPPCELPRDVGLRLVDCLRPIMTARWDSYTLGVNKRISPLRLSITTNDGQVFEVDVLADIGLQRAIMIFRGQECSRGGELHAVGPLVEEAGMAPYRFGCFDEGLCMRGVVREVFEGISDNSNRSEEIEEIFLYIEASAGHRPIEELDKWREEHPPKNNDDE